MNHPLALLNQLTPAEFLAEYWQKKPLVIRQAIPNFQGLLTPNELAGLACEEDAQSRIVQNKDDTWLLSHGPFDEETLTALPEKNWTLLVQSVNHHLTEAAALLSQFNFIPHARLDDLMISYAPTGGSVGPHMDSYDVFLLQGSGKRRWKINAKPDLTLVDGVPLRILKHFDTEQEWVLEPGDMLYLPPNIAHYGISEDDNCMTYSIGFRVPKSQELIEGFLAHLQDTIQIEGLYEDADLSLQQHPAAISDAMIEKVSTILQSITWDKATVSDFLGCYLTEPKPDVLFAASVKKITIEAFAQLLAEQSIWLDLKSQLLFDQRHQFYINGERLDISADILALMCTLADQRFLQTTSLAYEQRLALANTLHAALMAGYLHID
ncbi:MAG: cupin domain-containing protein [Methylophilaceae bacterium]|jgi:50S ribosomal protein L16 3-hydroxylase|nr:MAG: cupin domain-containing protein [Methylophilaceae bacterium]